MTEPGAPALRSHLGQVHLDVQPNKVAELARALRADRTTVPPTFTVVAAHSTAPGESPNERILQAAGLDGSRVLLGSIGWFFDRPLAPGDSLTGTVHLLDVRERTSQAGRRLRIARGETRWADRRGDPVVRVEVTLIEPAAASAATETARPSTGSAPRGREEMVFSRTDIVRYAGAAGDFNPLHHDVTWARRLGYPDVFAMGLLPGGVLAARAAAELAPRPLASVGLRFQGQVWPDVPYSVTGEGTGPGSLRLSLINPEQVVVLTADAVSTEAGS